MNNEDKQLLLQDLCARLPYGIIVNIQGDEFDSYKHSYNLIAISKFGSNIFCKVHHPIYGVVSVEDIKPYLRPMSSMTDGEYVEYSKLWNLQDEFPTDADIRLKADVFDWLNANHFDYRSLIPKKLAIEVTKENNPYK